MFFLFLKDKFENTALGQEGGCNTAFFTTSVLQNVKLYRFLCLFAKIG